MSTKTVKIKDLVVHKLAQAPDRADESHVEDLRGAIQSGAKLPRPQVMEVEGVGIVPYNGHHTIEAWEKEGYKEVSVEYTKGTIEDLRLAAAKANKDQHALKRSRKTKEWAVRSFLEVKPNLSDGFVSREVGVSDNLVARIRKELEAEGKGGTNGKRVGADGKARKMPKKKPKPVPVSSKFDFKAWDEKFGWCVRAIDALSSLVGDKGNKKKALGGMNGAAKVVETWKKALAKQDEEDRKAAEKKAQEEAEAAKKAESKEAAV